MDFMGFMEAMGTNNIPEVAAFFIGLMTAMSPCPMITNITAVAYISKRIDDSRHTLLVGLIYTAGRAAAYVLVASTAVVFGVSIQSLSSFLQENGELLLGPFLLLLGILILAADRLPASKGSEKLGRFKEKLGEKGYFGGFLLGFVFALSFCPFSAVLFFGMLIPLALAKSDPFILPSVYAAATGLPVIFSSMLLASGARNIGMYTGRMQQIQQAFRYAAGLVFLLAGIYQTGLTLFA